MTVLDEKNGALFLRIASALKRLSVPFLLVDGGHARLPEDRMRVALINGHGKDAPYAVTPHLFVAAQHFSELRRLPVCCAAAALPGVGAADADDINAQYVVTYGMDPCDTLTLSSAVPTPVLCLVREIVALNGTRLGIQEIPLPGVSYDKTLLPAAATLLLCGIDPQELIAAL